VELNGGGKEHLADPLVQSKGGFYDVRSMLLHRHRELVKLQVLRVNAAVNCFQRILAWKAESEDAEMALENKKIHP